ncbi:hypothetical protein [Agarivorans albus]|uniref:Uncharacterized protein n=1 Tax=Agarivorans albus MKT 106 TaxID=1331007 RepID=R9PP66_AGAAL|nr:hypothetical protein [Agarivorans albus]GAD03182.1 hypothetical protein AALB_3262 [Agarivorans albus MKT 106]
MLKHGLCLLVDAKSTWEQFRGQHIIYGGGIRQLTSRQLGLKWGIDLAPCETSTAAYLQFGSAL